MNLDSLITFLGWATLTYSLLHINFTFSAAAAAAINQAIENHNDTIRAEFLLELAAEDTEQPEDKS